MIPGVMTLYLEHGILFFSLSFLAIGFYIATQKVDRAAFRFLLFLTFLLRVLYGLYGLRQKLV